VLVYKVEDDIKIMIANKQRHFLQK